MRKNLVTGIIIAIIFMVIPCYAVYADLDLPEIGLKSYGNIMYEDENGVVQLYAEDIAFLREKIMSIPKNIFDAGIYSHVHEWKYIDVNENTHTRTCDKCGSLHNITNEHNPIKSEECSLEYQTKIYDGYLHTCKCGYTWIEERNHNPIYDVTDEINHKVTCVLAGTKYCLGMEPYDEDHTLIEIPERNDTHTAKCDKCSFEKKEECNFTKEFVDEITGEKCLLCECGNYIVESILDPGDDNSVSSNNLIIQYESED